MKSPDESLCESDSINATILEYYNKFGKDRRLEKYLRIRCPINDDTDASHSGKSSSKLENSDLVDPNPVVTKNVSDHDAEAAEALPNPSTVSSDAETVDPSSSKKQISKTKAAAKRLEWDSLGDVGYGKQMSKDNCSTKTFDANLMRILNSKSTNTGTSIEGSNASKSSKVSQTLSEKQDEKWRRTLEKIKKKYDNQLLDTSSCNTGSFQFNTDSFSGLSTPNAAQNNKSIQTSRINLQSKKVQVSLAGSRSSSISFHPKPRRGSTYSTSSPSVSSTVKQLCCQNKKSSSEASVPSSEISSKVPSDLEAGINLLCLLIESKNLSTAKKKKLAKRIVSKISNQSNSDSSKGVEPSTGNSETISGRISPLIETGKGKPIAKSSESDSSPGQQLKNIKNSSRETSSYSPSRVNRRPTSGLNKQKVRTKMTKSRSADDVAQFMRTWLDPMTKSEWKYERVERSKKDLWKKEKPIFVPLVGIPTVCNESKIVFVDKKAGGDFVPTGYRRSSEVLDFITNERKSHLKWIESEIEHLENLKDLLSKSKTNFKPVNTDQQVYSSVIQNMYDRVASSSGSIPCSEDLSNQVDYRETEIISEKEEINLKKLYTRTETRREQEAIIYDSAGGDTMESEKTKGTIKNITLEVIEEKKLPKRNYQRTKDHAEKQFRSKLQTPHAVSNDEMANFVQNRKQQFLERCNKSRSPEITSESSTENRHYSEPRQKEIARHGDGENTSSATGSTNFFISSESVSIPEIATSSTTTTTHQYDHQRGIGIQTTDSLFQLQKFNEQESQGTMRTYCYRKNKQTQTKPQSIAYVISFDNFDDSMNPAEMKLRDYLDIRRPQFAQRINERVVILTQIRNLRKERDKEIREIVENYSVSTIPKKLKELPPPPTKYLRVFSTREMKARTQRKYSQLPEVTERKRRQKLDKTKKSNRIITDMFNKRIQQRVRDGKLNLEQSMTVI